MAQPLFWTKNTTGAFITAAKFMASWTSPWEEAPSPKYVMATPSLPSVLPAASVWPWAQPTACSTDPATTAWIGASRDCIGS